MSKAESKAIPVRLADLFRIKHGFAFKGEHFTDAPGPVLLTPGNFESAGGLKLRPGKDRSYEGDFPGEFVLRPNDLIIVMTDLTQEASILGAPAFVPAAPQCLHNQRLGKIVELDEERIDRRFLYYVFNSKGFRDRLKQTATGSTVRHTSPSRIGEYELALPPLEDQRRIASILGAYDDLIEVNRRRVAVLEEMARGLFEEWFVRFRFPGHEGHPIIDTPDGPLPQDWSYSGLYDVASVTFGFPFKSRQFSSDQSGARVVRIRDVPPGTSETWTAEPFDEVRYGIEDGDLLVGMDGIFHTAIWIGGPAALNQRVARLRPLKDLSIGWLRLSLMPMIKHLEATISGTTVAHLGARHLEKLRLLVAPKKIRQQCDRFLDTIEIQVLNLRKSNLRLERARDHLLPRLISGELSVTAAEREVEAAA